MKNTGTKECQINVSEFPLNSQTLHFSSHDNYLHGFITNVTQFFGF